MPLCFHYPWWWPHPPGLKQVGAYGKGDAGSTSLPLAKGQSQLAEGDPRIQRPHALREGARTSKGLHGPEYPCAKGAHY